MVAGPKALRLAWVAVLFLSAVYGKKDDVVCPEDPYADPSTDLCNPFRYVPNKGINIAAAVLYFAVAVVLTFHAVRKPANYFLVLVIGAWCEGIGLALRVALRTNLHSSGLYIVCYLFVVLSPCAFLAGDYILLGRLVQYLDGHRYIRPFRASHIAWIFIASDIITFCIQGAGGGLSTSHDVNTAQLGGKMFLAGIAIQMASFIFFTITWAIFGFRTWVLEDKQLWNRPRWKPLYWALGFTCICFLIRSIYRTIELSQGYVGYIATHERFYLGLDCLPLLFGIATYMYFWPGKYLHFENKPESLEKFPNREEEDLENGNDGYSAPNKTENANLQSLSSKRS
nr:integral membrane protein [Cryptococcus depauperatus CBS 7855]